MSRPQGVTISDVAKAAGVSVATVSRVMNGAPTVGPELADRVRVTAADLGYRPNAIAQGLARGRTGTIGVLVPDLSNPYCSRRWAWRRSPRISLPTTTCTWSTSTSRR